MTTKTLQFGDSSTNVDVIVDGKLSIPGITYSNANVDADRMILVGSVSGESPNVGGMTGDYVNNGEPRLSTRLKFNPNTISLIVGTNGGGTVNCGTIANTDSSSSGYLCINSDIAMGGTNHIFANPVDSVTDNYIGAVINNTTSTASGDTVSNSVTATASTACKFGRLLLRKASTYIISASVKFTPTSALAAGNRYSSIIGIGSSTKKSDTVTTASGGTSVLSTLEKSHVVNGTSSSMSASVSNISQTFTYIVSPNDNDTYYYLTGFTGVAGTYSINNFNAVCIG